MNKINVLIIGSGGREHALTWKISKSPLVNRIFCAPGNPGMAEIAECVNIDIVDIESLYNFANEKNIGLTIVGPEDPLVNGIVDKFQSGNLKIFGPSMKAATLEGSKVFSKNLMKKHGIPTGEYMVFKDLYSAINHVKSIKTPVVIKADGLAKGKGVFVCKTEKEAIDSLNLIMKDRIFGPAGDKVIVEEFLEGKEVSIFALTDSKTILILESAQDHKAVFNDDKGPNTGGMGAYSPSPIVTPNLSYEIEKHVLVPAVHAMKKEGRPFKGLLYAGLIVNPHEIRVKLLEFNVRFGDPETQPIMMRMQTDLMAVLLAATEGKLDSIEMQWDSRPSVCVVVASKGYPDKYETGKEIFGLDNLKNLDDVQVFHAGTEEKNGKIFTKGGRVLNVTAIGNDIIEAQKKVYEATAQISFDGAYYRTDIASKAIKAMTDKVKPPNSKIEKQR